MDITDEATESVAIWNHVWRSRPLTEAMTLALNSKAQDAFDAMVMRWAQRSGRDWFYYWGTETWPDDARRWVRGAHAQRAGED